MIIYYLEDTALDVGAAGVARADEDAIDDAVEAPESVDADDDAEDVTSLVTAEVGAAVTGMYLSCTVQ
jgi:hypothetical protein